MLNRVAIISMLAASLVPMSTRAQECSRVADSIGREYMKSLQASDSLSMKKYDFCRYDYSKANKDEQAQIEGSYAAVASGKAAASKSEVTEKQSQVCQGNFGLDFLKTLNTFESSTISKGGTAVVQSCFQQRSVRITDVTYAYPAMTFVVSNGTNTEVRIRGVAANPPALIDSCDVKNTSGMFRSYLLPNNNAVVVCTLKEQKTADRSQTGFGGGVITVDVPDSDMPPLPVPMVRTPEFSATELRLKAQLAEAGDQMAALRRSLADEEGKKKEAEKALQATNDALTSWKQTMLSRTTLLTTGYAVAGTVALDCADWGKDLNAKAAAACGGAANALVRVVDNRGGGTCGLTIAAYVCK